MNWSGGCSQDVSVVMMSALSAKTARKIQHLDICRATLSCNAATIH